MHPREHRREAEPGRVKQDDIDDRNAVQQQQTTDHASAGPPPSAPAMAGPGPATIRAAAATTLRSSSGIGLTAPAGSIECGSAGEPRPRLNGDVQALDRLGLVQREQALDRAEEPAVVLDPLPVAAPSIDASAILSRRIVRFSSMRLVIVSRTSRCASLCTSTMSLTPVTSFRKACLQIARLHVLFGEALCFPEVRLLLPTDVVERRQEHEEAQVGLPIALLEELAGLLLAHLAADRAADAGGREQAAVGGEVHAAREQRIQEAGGIADHVVTRAAEALRRVRVVLLGVGLRHHLPWLDDLLDERRLVDRLEVQVVERSGSRHDAVPVHDNADAGRAVAKRESTRASRRESSRRRCRPRGRSPSDRHPSSRPRSRRSGKSCDSGGSASTSWP